MNAYMCVSQCEHLDMFVMCRCLPGGNWKSMMFL